MEVYGKVPEYSGHGRPPSRKRPQPDRKYLQIIKERDGKGNAASEKRRRRSAEMEETDSRNGGGTD